MTEAAVELAPAILAWAERIRVLSRSLPELASEDMDARRQAERRLSDALAIEFCDPVVPGVSIRDDVVDGPVGPLTLRRYRPNGLPPAAPTEVFLHGGGFISGSVHEVINDRLLTARAGRAGVQVISVEYRLAPEHPYPAAVHDTVATIDLLCAEPERFGVDVTRLGIAGASAGAGIAASAALLLRDRGGVGLVHQSLEVPAVALEAFGRFAHGYGLDGYEKLIGLYLGERRGPSVAAAQPVFVSDLTGLPPTFIQVAEFDPLRDSGLEYGERLRAAGVPTSVHVGAGHVHGSPGLTATFPPARTWHRRSAAAARLAYHRAPDRSR
ncbi:alpha/beta hydrolase fold domain-containing protein [Microbacterium arborescens]|uniref:alpha/beta hydrolase fold domain-containing protein n=1 Tax=Microbacterium arborescens TaxID=33883 RepID=UPI0027852880|nr:alpha/beta hydrolase fold domain-containing protein [Microbacterium arborescens]MDQ1218275.1 acetyl esterase [Microbacterium arborescens]